MVMEYRTPKSTIKSLYANTIGVNTKIFYQ